jgi:hypothetical protein
LIIINIEIFPDVVKYFGGIVHKNFTDLFDRLVVSFVYKLMIVFAMDVFFCKFNVFVELVVMRLEAEPYPFVKIKVPSIMFSIRFQF